MGNYCSSQREINCNNKKVYPTKFFYSYRIYRLRELYNKYPTLHNLFHGHPYKKYEYCAHSGDYRCCKLANKRCFRRKYIPDKNTIYNYIINEYDYPDSKSIWLSESQKDEMHTILSKKTN